MSAVLRGLAGATLPGRPGFPAHPGQLGAGGVEVTLGPGAQLAA